MLSKEDILHVVKLAGEACGAATDAPDDEYVQAVLGSVYGNACEILQDYQSWKNREDMGATRDEPSVLAKAVAELLETMMLLKISANLSPGTAAVLNQLAHADPCVGPGNMLKQAYRSGATIRKFFYGGFDQTAKNYVWGVVNGVVGLNYTCPGVPFGTRPGIVVAPHPASKQDYTIDHVKPVARHWNLKGHDMSRAARRTWLNKTSNLIPICSTCNSKKGGYYGNVSYNYNTVVGGSFTGMF